MSAPRKPAAFRVEPSPQVEERGASAPATRKPRALKTEIAIVTPAEVDAFDLENLDSGLPAQIADPSRRPGWKSLFSAHSAFSFLWLLGSGPTA
jgi:putative membrane protein